MDNKILVNELVKQGLLDEELSKKILKESSLTRQNVEVLIYDRRIVDEETVAAIKSKLLGVPYKKIKPEDIDDEVLKIISEETVRTYKVIPISRSDELLVVGMLNPDNLKTQEALKFIAKQLKVNLGVYLITSSVWEAILRRYSPFQSEVEEAVKSLNFQPGQGLVSGQKIIRLEEGVAVSEEAPIIKIEIGRAHV